MMTEILTAIGLVLVIEGLVYALAPSSLINSLIEALRSLPESARRNLGALTAVTGLIILWFVKG